MKKKFSILFTFLLLLACITTPAFAGNSSSTLFQDLTISDGAKTDAILSALEKDFVQNPTDFLEELTKQDSSVQELVITHLIYYSLEDDEASKQLSEAVLSISKNPKANQLVTEFSQLQETINQKNTINIDDYNNVDAFNSEEVKRLITLYQKQNFQYCDEEFYCSLIKYYQTDRRLFVKTLSDLDNDEIDSLLTNMNFVSKKFGYDLTTFNDTSSVELSDSEEQLLQEINNTFHKSIINNLEEIASNISERALPPTPTIDSFYYSGTMEVGKTVTLTLPLTESTSTNTNRSYRVKVFCIRNGVEYQKIDTTYTIPSGSKTISKNFSLIFTNPGQFTTRVEVFSTNGTKLTSRTGKYPDTTYGYWSISIKLLKDRTKPGTFALYDAANTLICQGPALGKSESGAAMNVTNGNTPTGNYTGILGSVQSNTTSYGPYKVIELSGKNNPYVPPRSGIWIHGGRSQTTLTPTHGCVRVFNKDQLALQNNITTLTSSSNGHYKTGNVSITES